MMSESKVLQQFKTNLIDAGYNMADKDVEVFNDTLEGYLQANALENYFVRSHPDTWMDAMYARSNMDFQSEHEARLFMMTICAGFEPLNKYDGDFN